MTLTPAEAAPPARLGTGESRRAAVGFSEAGSDHYERSPTAAGVARLAEFGETGLMATLESGVQR